MCIRQLLLGNSSYNNHPNSLNLSEIWHELQCMWQESSKQDVECGCCLCFREDEDSLGTSKHCCQYTTQVCLCSRKDGTLGLKVTHKVKGAKEQVSPGCTAKEHQNHIGFCHTHLPNGDGWPVAGFSDSDFVMSIKDKDGFALVMNGQNIYGIMRSCASPASTTEEELEDAFNFNEHIKEILQTIRQRLGARQHIYESEVFAICNEHIIKRNLQIAKKLWLSFYTGVMSHPLKLNKILPSDLESYHDQLSQDDSGPDEFIPCRFIAIDKQRLDQEKITLNSSSNPCRRNSSNNPRTRDDRDLYRVMATVKHWLDEQKISLISQDKISLDNFFNWLRQFRQHFNLQMAHYFQYAETLLHKANKVLDALQDNDDYHTVLQFLGDAKVPTTTPVFFTALDNPPQYLEWNDPEADEGDEAYTVTILVNDEIQYTEPTHENKIEWPTDIEVISGNSYEWRVQSRHQEIRGTFYILSAEEQQALQTEEHLDDLPQNRFLNDLRLSMIRSKYCLYQKSIDTLRKWNDVYSQKNDACSLSNQVLIMRLLSLLYHKLAKDLEQNGFIEECDWSWQQAHEYLEQSYEYLKKLKNYGINQK